MKHLLLILALAVLAVSAANAQCVMCFRTAAAQQVERARVMNIGIGIMLFPPVLILGGFLYLAYRRNSSCNDQGALKKPARRTDHEGD